jgi:nitric oxide reductase subunit C
MRTAVIALAAAFVSYSAWVHLHPSEPKASAPMTPPQARGFAVWRRNNCQACHQLYGMGGYLGPDLTNAAGRLTPARIHAVVTEGSTPMPRFELTRDERDELIEFLTYVNTTGSWPPRGWPPPDWDAGRP